jgi:transcriptional regulator with XRE-family HTH domain
MSKVKIEDQVTHTIRSLLRENSLRELESVSGVSFNTLGRWAREGCHSRTLDALRTFADFLGLEIRLVGKRDPLAGLPTRMRVTR